ncbi:MAG TPA: pirin family protein [Acidimicrobiales bacterium]|jgi:redox-sensitive bicupin YhaK (pirin superfamily)|nr:pirin family protein [Acidimicrobiales bacterium]
MSGPVTTEDVAATADGQERTGAAVVVLEPGRIARVGSLPVRRVLPHRPRKTVGAWCFADHMGPVASDAAGLLGIGPHPHLGLQTVTWLLEGEMLHLDSLGSEQLIRPGQLNLMTAGHGVAHAEEDPGRARRLHGIQLWVAQPEATRNGPAAFEHHDELPRVALDGGEGTILVGDYDGTASPARRDTDHVGVELALCAPGALLALRHDYEHALIVLEGSLRVDDQVVEPGVLAYLGTARHECRLDLREPARALLLGGTPFPEKLLMWWNFVARTTAEASEARRQWTARDERFGTVNSQLERIEVGKPPWE